MVSLDLHLLAPGHLTLLDGKDIVCPKSSSGSHQDLA